MDVQEAVNKAFSELQSNIELQPHQGNFCDTTQDLVFFGGGAGN